MPDLAACPSASCTAPVATPGLTALCLAWRLRLQLFHFVIASLRTSPDGGAADVELYRLPALGSPHSFISLHVKDHCREPPETHSFPEWV